MATFDRRAKSIIQSEAPAVKDDAAEALAALPRRVDAYVAECLGVDWDSAEASGVTVNDIPACGAGLVFPADDTVAVGDTILPRPAPPRPRARVVAYHKPRRVPTDASPGTPLAAAAAKFGVPGVMPVGQLDVNTTGLLLFTDDGALSRLVNAPGRLAKVYRVGVDAPRSRRLALTSANVAALTAPLPLVSNRAERRRDSGGGDGKSGRAARFEKVTQIGGGAPFGDETRPEGCAAKSRFDLEVTIAHGANHVVKRLFSQRCGIAVRSLHRSSIGRLGVAGVPEGGHRVLDDAEVDALWADVGGDGALLALKRAHLLCRARDEVNDGPGRDMRLVVYVGGRAAVCDSERCFAAFPGLRCKHDPEVAPPAPRLGSPNRGLAKTESGFLVTAPDLALGRAPSGVLPTAKDLAAGEVAATRAAFFSAVDGCVDPRADFSSDDSEDERTLAEARSGLLEDLAAEAEEERSLAATRSGLLATAEDLAAEEAAVAPPPPPERRADEEKCPVCLTEWASAGAEGAAVRPCCGRAICEDCASFLSMMGAKAQCPLCKTTRG